MAAFNKFTSFAQALGEAKHNLATNVLKAVFSNTAPVAGNAVLADIVQIVTGGGYTQMGAGAGGITLDTVTWVAGKLSIADEVFTATGTVADFRYIVLVNETAPNDELIGWYDYGSVVSLVNSGETFTIDFDGTNGVLTLA
jgi:hypothetical protein